MGERLVAPLVADRKWRKLSNEKEKSTFQIKIEIIPVVIEYICLFCLRITEKLLPNRVCQFFGKE